MLRRIPTAAIETNSDDPPRLMKGSTIPVKGSSPVTTPALISACPASKTVSPQPSTVPNASRARSAMRNPRQVSRTKRAMTSKHPNRPSSSPTTAKMLSVCGTGR